MVAIEKQAASAMSSIINEPNVIANGAVDAHWDDAVACHFVPQFLQTSGWAELKSRFGWQATRVDCGEAGRALILLRRAAGMTLAYVPRGPVVDWRDVNKVRTVLAATADAARRAGGSVLIVEPELADGPEAQALLLAQGLRRSPNTIQPPSTVMLDIVGDEDAVLARMKSKWRYNVRLAARKGVTVRAMRRDELPTFQRLMKETAVRDRFYVHSEAYYRAAYDLFVPHMGEFLVAEYAGEPLGALVVLRCGPMAWYVWGASSNRERSRMPNYALQWAAMRWAREHGCTRYDFWGIPDEIGQVAVGLANGSGKGTPVDAIPVDLDALPGHDLWGVYRFKQGFGGEVVRHVGTWEMPLHPVGYRVVQAGRMAQRAVREFTKRQLNRQPATSRWQPVVDRATWQRALRGLPRPHVLQGWEWGRVKAQTEWRATRRVLYDEGGKPLAAVQFLDRQLLPYVPLRIGYVPKGPTVDWTNMRLVESALEQVETLAHRHNCIFVKIDPDVAEMSAHGIRVRHLLRQHGWRVSRDQIQFKNTAYTDLEDNEDALLARLKSKWRYNVRLAQRRGITVREGNEADLEAFYRLYAETGERDGFLIRPFAYYRTTWVSYLAAEAEADNPAGGALLLAEHAEEDAPVAGIFLMRYGDTAWYFYGASSERRRRDMPNYLLQWEALRWAKGRGCNRYDWWGAPTDIDNANDAMQGVWQFKQGFDAEFAEHIGAWDYVAWPWAYRAYTELMPRGMALLRRLRGLDSGSHEAST